MLRWSGSVLDHLCVFPAGILWSCRMWRRSCRLTTRSVNPHYDWSSRSWVCTNDRTQTHVHLYLEIRLFHLLPFLKSERFCALSCVIFIFTSATNKLSSKSLLNGKTNNSTTFYRAKRREFCMKINQFSCMNRVFVELNCCFICFAFGLPPERRNQVEYTYSTASQCSQLNANTLTQAHLGSAEFCTYYLALLNCMSLISCASGIVLHSKFFGMKLFWIFLFYQNVFTGLWRCVEPLHLAPGSC